MRSLACLPIPAQRAHYEMWCAVLRDEYERRRATWRENSPQKEPSLCLTLAALAVLVFLLFCLAAFVPNDAGAHPAPGSFYTLHTQGGSSMSATVLSVQTLKSGDLVNRINTALDALGKDILDRPETSKARTITVTIAITPKPDFNEIDYSVKTGLPPDPACKSICYTGKEGKLVLTTTAENLMKPLSLRDAKAAAANDA